ncbi:MAG: hypothetical protein GY853_10040 [PVC group bacterium]|nr:hypothetical protein [PVC group bacterium]
MNESQAQTLLDFIDENWEDFEGMCMSNEEDPERIRYELEKTALGG